ncbi:MAG: hypothetical protein EOO43_26725 [Flavobacterium sp.]|nr:MAG: hypothetical protein EOO43_26725 [Flavobacterium sp.]
MKKIIGGALIICFLITSCDNMGGFFKSESANNTTDSVNATMSAVVVRDLSITPANAYSDLFLDSTAVEQYIQQENLNDTLARDLRNFYNSRNFQFAWFATQGVTEQGRNFWNLYDSNIDSVNYKADAALDKQLDTLLSVDSLTITANDTAFIKTELGLTKEFIKYAKNNKRTDWKQMVPSKKLDVMQLADSIIKQKDTPFYSGNIAYSKMREQLKKYHAIAQKGGWKPITLGSKSIKKGTSVPSVTQIKKRLQLTGDYNAIDTSTIFNDSLELAIKSVQQRFGFNPTGIITDTLINSLNVSGSTTS